MQGNWGGRQQQQYGDNRSFSPNLSTSAALQRLSRFIVTFKKWVPFILIDVEREPYAGRWRKGFSLAVSLRECRRAAHKPRIFFFWERDGGGRLCSLSVYRLDQKRDGTTIFINQLSGSWGINTISCYIDQPKQGLAIWERENPSSRLQVGRNVTAPI